MTDRKGGRKDQVGPWQCMKWVLLVCCVTCVWQVIQLNGPGGSFLMQQPHETASSALSGAFIGKLAAIQKSRVKALAQGLGLSVPAESPYAASAGESGAGTAADAAAAAGATANGAASGDQEARARRTLELSEFAFPADGPLDGIASSDEAAQVVDDEDPLAGEDADSRAFEPLNDGSCSDVHPNADSPNMLHVMYACDLSQIEGVQASIASVVQNAADPDDLTIHVMVQKKWVPDFKSRFGIPKECWGVVTTSGVLVRVHSVDGVMIERAVAKVSPSVRKERGAIDSIENFARFYMHLVIEKAVVVYLDADTIVQADLGQLRSQLVKSGKTVGFVSRETTVLMDKFLREPKDCKFSNWKAKFPNWSEIMKMPAYNVGVFIVNLQRWKDLRVAERVEELVAAHNQCDGKLWVGGSQPPLLLAFLNRPKNEVPDFIVLDPSWNSGDLGWRTGIAKDSLRQKNVLHWNGNQKPWYPSGLYRDVWLPYRQKFEKLMRPFDDDPNVVQWYKNSECVDDAKAYSCDDTCAVEGGQCDINAFASITSQAAVDSVALFAGATCKQYSPAKTADEWDGPWILGDNCGFHSGPTWKASCSLRPACSYHRICPCFGIRGVKKAAVAEAESADSEKKKDGSGGKKEKGTTTLSPTQIAEKKKCPYVQLLDQWSDENPDACILGKNYGCAADGKNMWASGACAGMFSVSNVTTSCGHYPQDSASNAKAVGPAALKVADTCEPGRMPKSKASCGLMLLTSFFTTKKDWQREKYAKPKFAKFQKLYQTSMRLGMNVTVIYDELPADMMSLYASDRWRWHKINLTKFDKAYGVNDVRYFFFNELLKSHTEWEAVFVIDAFDVRVKMNPCPLQAGKLYVGSERDKLKGHPWMKARFQKLGGKYNNWYEQELDSRFFIMNCGITGGTRAVMLKFFKKMIAVMSDPELAVRKKNEDVNVNMAALNYLVYTDFKDKIVTGQPVHSAYKRAETKRKDVWFIHK